MKKLKDILGSDAFQKVMIGLCVIVMGISLVSIIHSARAMMAIDREISAAKAAAAAPQRKQSRRARRCARRFACG